MLYLSAGLVLIDVKTKHGFQWARTEPNLVNIIADFIRNEICASETVPKAMKLFRNLLLVVLEVGAKFSTPRLPAIASILVLTQRNA